MSDKVERAVSCFKQGFNCSQAIFSTYAEQFGLAPETALKIASGFGAGMRMAETCGAVTGAFMVIGLKYGAVHPADKDARQKTYKLVEEYTHKFKSRNGSVICKELLGCDISTPQGAKTAQQKNLFSSFCPTLVRDAAEILEQILEPVT